MKPSREIRYKKLEQFTEEEIKQANIIVSKSKYLPKYHIYPDNGLLNDPNGLIYHNGKYYIHYQVHPVDTIHGLKYWYLVTTKDFVNYEKCGFSNKPEIDAENYGVFSGSAFLDDGVHKVVYTGNHRTEKFEREEFQIIGSVVDNKVVNKEVAVKFDSSITLEHVRDPKIITVKDNKYMVIGAQLVDGTGSIIIYKFKDNKWEYTSHLKSKFVVPNGYMWECPNIDFVNDKWVIMFSLQGVNYKNGPTLRNSNNLIYIVCDDINFENGTLVNEKMWKDFDNGTDIYATQTFWVNNKLLCYSWVGTIDVAYPSDKDHWSGMLSMPLELSLKNDVLVRKPYEEFVKNVLGESVSIKASGYSLDKKSFMFNASLKKDNYITLKNKNGNKVEISFKDNKLSFDRSLQSEAVTSDFGDNRYIELNKNEINIEVWVDNSVMEVFVDDYNHSMTSRFFIDGDFIIDSNINKELIIKNIKSIKYFK